MESVFCDRVGLLGYETITLDTRETACLIFQLSNPQCMLWRNCLMSDAPDNETDAVSQTGPWNIPYHTPLLFVLCVVCLEVHCIIEHQFFSVRRVTMRSDEGKFSSFGSRTQGATGMPLIQRTCSLRFLTRSSFRPASPCTRVGQ